MDLSNELSWEAGSFSPPQSPQVFLFSSFEVLFPHAGTLVCVVCLAPQLFLLFYLHANVGLPTLPAAILPTLVLQLLPSCKFSPPGFPSLPLLPVWVNVSSLIPWLLDFHTV